MIEDCSTVVKATGACRAGSAETDADEVAEPDGPRAASGLPGGSDSLPLTPLQAGMVYETVLSNRPSVNCEQIVIRMAGDAGDLAAMTEAWRAVIRPCAWRSTGRAPRGRGNIRSPIR